MVVRVYEISDYKTTYGYLTVKKEGITKEEIQDVINAIKSDVIKEVVDWSLDDIFERFPEDWDWSFQSADDEVAV